MLGARRIRRRAWRGRSSGRRPMFPTLHGVDKPVDSAVSPAYIGGAPGPGGGIGRRARFRSVCREAWRFESSPGHHQPSKWLNSQKPLVHKGFLPHAFTQAFTPTPEFGDEGMVISIHLILVRDTWYANVRVPSDIVETYGKANVRRSLGTKDEREAGRLVHKKVAEIEREFDKHRATVKAKSEVRLAVEPVPTPASFASLAGLTDERSPKGSLRHARSLRGSSGRPESVLPSSASRTRVYHLSR